MNLSDDVFQYLIKYLSINKLKIIYPSHRNLLNEKYILNTLCKQHNIPKIVSNIVEFFYEHLIRYGEEKVFAKFHDSVNIKTAVYESNIYIIWDKEILLAITDNNIKKLKFLLPLSDIEDPNLPSFWSDIVIEAHKSGSKEIINYINNFNDSTNNLKEIGEASIASYKGCLKILKVIPRLEETTENIIKHAKDLDTIKHIYTNILDSDKCFIDTIVWSTILYRNNYRSILEWCLEQGYNKILVVVKAVRYNRIEIARCFYTDDLKEQVGRNKTTIMNDSIKNSNLRLLKWMIKTFNTIKIEQFLPISMRYQKYEITKYIINYLEIENFIAICLDGEIILVKLGLLRHKFSAKILKKIFLRVIYGRVNDSDVLDILENKMIELFINVDELYKNIKKRKIASGSKDWLRFKTRLF